MKHLFLALPNVRLGTIASMLAVLAFAPVAHAGILDSGGALTFSGVGGVGATSLSFQCNQPGDPQCATLPAGSGDFAVAGSSDSFVQYDGTFGVIKNLNNALQPLNTVFSLPNWITFDLNNQIALELSFLPLGTDTVSTDCAGLTHCTPQNALLITPSNPGGLSDFNFDQVANGTTATFFVAGTAHASDLSIASYSGIFTATFTGENPQQVYAGLLAGDAYTYSGQIVIAAAAPVPEPASLAVFGVALGALGFSRRRKRS